MVKTLGSDRHNKLVAILIEKREGSGLTQTELAAKLGEYQSFVARLESGQRRIDVVEFIQLSEILRFDPATVISQLAGKIERR
ncbi:helix-turn-helix domain-containing protein [Pseudaminobacter sp. NGMCC 1.201702]|uniref:helix-turn-helix domain-containing protein n=1 Tax=Pseudaminobacter sp. NGMCC 1.201702 TaxID=3391825 RepID=UPI0039F0E184